MGREKRSEKGWHPECRLRGLEAKAGVLSLEEGPQGGVSGQKASASPAEQLVREGAGVGTLVNFSEKLLP